jgi:transcription elongation factor Elf1
MSFTCKRCGYEGLSRQALERHLKKKFTCEVAPNRTDVPVQTLLQDLNEAYQTKRYVCEFCESRFAHVSNLYSHKKRCVEALLRENTRLQSLLAQPVVLPQDEINPLGKEDVSYFEEDILFSCYKNKDLATLVDHIHFHPDHKKNHNISIKNIKLNQIEYLCGDTWKVEHKHTVLPLVIRNACKYMEKYRSSNARKLSRAMGQNDYFESSVWIKQHGDTDDRDKVLYSNTKKQLFNLCITRKKRPTQ